MKFLVSLLGLGISGGGIFIGTLQQNLSNTKTEIDRLFEEIEGDIRKFSEKNPLTKTVANEIKNGSNSLSGSDSVSRKKRDTESDEKAESKNTLGVWTNIWIQLLSNYIQKLWIGNNDINSLDSDLEFRKFSLSDKQKAVDAAEKAIESEKQRFENVLSQLKKEIRNIYKKMKNFLQIMELPKKYNTSDHANTPYEEYVQKILTE